jgi:hypothetical protein
MISWGFLGSVLEIGRQVRTPVEESVCMYFEFFEGSSDLCILKQTFLPRLMRKHLRLVLFIKDFRANFLRISYLAKPTRRMIAGMTASTVTVRKKIKKPSQYLTLA